MTGPGRTEDRAPKVLRITVDECLSVNLVRLLVARLRPGTREVDLAGTGQWQDEETVMATSETVVSALGIPDQAGELARAVQQVFGRTSGRVLPRDVLWRGLTEGQVFVTGRFKVAGRRGEAPVIIPGGDHWRVLRVDGMESVKRSIAQLYSRVLTSGRRRRGTEN